MSPGCGCLSLPGYTGNYISAFLVMSLHYWREPLPLLNAPYQLPGLAQQPKTQLGKLWQALLQFASCYFSRGSGNRTMLSLKGSGFRNSFACQWFLAYFCLLTKFCPLSPRHLAIMGRDASKSALFLFAPPPPPKSCPLHNPAAH